MYFILCVYSYFKDLRRQQLVRMVRIAINIHFEPLYIHVAIIKLFNANLAVRLETTCIMYDHFFPFLDFRKSLINDTVNPLSPKNDKHKFSPNNINA